MNATSEIRRRDRRGVTPDHVLYMAMKIMRLRINEGIYTTFRKTYNTSKITKKMIENKNVIETCLNKNLSYLKSIPNSIHYWLSKKKTYSV